MVLITFTNIVVDDFGYAKRNPLKRFIYFLTHMHADHYQGISNGWSYGPIFCSEVTKQILLLRFPGVHELITTIPLRTPTIISLVADNPYYDVTVTFLDANHCPGSVMILFEGYFGRILHTGDMRFHQDMIGANPMLYPPNKVTKDLDGCSLEVDEMILDNTFCDPVFRFPDRDEAFDMLSEIVDKHPDHRVFVCVDSLGKEELMVALAEKYQTIIVVNEDRYALIQSINLRPELFSTNRDDGWIEVIRKSERATRLQEPKTIAITATGWANMTGYAMPDKQNFVVPYSLHSNFDEMHRFVKSIRPCLLQKVVLNKCGKSDSILNVTAFSQYMVSLTYLKQRVMIDIYNILQKGFEFFVNQYTDLTKFSGKYQNLLQNPQQQLKVQQDLGIVLGEQEQKDINHMEFQKQNRNVYQGKRRFNKGFKLPSPTHNDNFKITQFMKAKSRIENISKCKKSEMILVEEQEKIHKIIDLSTPQKIVYDIDWEDDAQRNNKQQSQNTSQRIGSQNNNVKEPAIIDQNNKFDDIDSEQQNRFQNLLQQQVSRKVVVDQLNIDNDDEIIELLKCFLQKKTKVQKQNTN